jgi:arylsulfatase A
VTSDNGPRIGTNGHKSAGDLRGYKSHIWEGGHRIPFIARWPGHIDAGTLSDAPIELTDLMGTVAGIIGIELPDEAGPDSYDISSALFGQQRDGPIREAIVSHSENGSYAIRQGPWKLILGTDGSGGWVAPSDDPYDPERPGQLYNLEEDPGERSNVIDERPEIVARLRTLLQRYRQTGRSR